MQSPGRTRARAPSMIQALAAELRNAARNGLRVKGWPTPPRTSDRLQPAGTGCLLCQLRPCRWAFICRRRKECISEESPTGKKPANAQSLRRALAPCPRSLRLENAARLLAVAKLRTKLKAPLSFEMPQPPRNQWITTARSSAVE